jgi:hypothetical protein
MKSRRPIYFWYLILALVSFIIFGINNKITAVEAEEFTVMGTGNIESCHVSTAVSALSDGVSTGGILDFSCGLDPNVINGTTKITNQDVTVSGGLLAKLRQTFSTAVLSGVIDRILIKG